MPPESPTPTPPDEGTVHAWVRPVAVILSCLILGFIGGWVLRGDEGDVTVLAPTADGAAAPAGTTPDVGTGGATTDTGTAPAATTGTVPGDTTGTAGTAAEPPTPGRGDVSLTVLNATSVAGLAASTAERAETLGYRDVETGNAPAASGPSVVYHRPGARQAAERAATDLEIVTVRALPRGGPIARTAPDSQVVVVLGSG